MTSTVLAPQKVETEEGRQKPVECAPRNEWIPPRIQSGAPLSTNVRVAMILESGDMPAVARMIDDILSNIPRVDLRIFVREGSHPFFEKGDMSQIASAHVVVLPQRVKGIGSRDFGPEFLKSVGTQYYRGRTIWCGYIVLDDVAKKWSRRKMEAELGSIIDQKRNLCLPPEKEEQEAA